MEFEDDDNDDNACELFASKIIDTDEADIKKIIIGLY